ncbi:MAG TPA: anthranilate synthase component I [Thermomicrobiales bacterium]|nr:anthranilate synthase component I [Thermomicrobiales bacterium]
MVGTRVEQERRRRTSPSLDGVRNVAGPAAERGLKRVAIYQELPADLETPVAVYLKLTAGARRPGFLLESIEGGMRIARYSFIGGDPLYSIILRDGEIHGLSGDPFPATYDDPLVALGDILGQFSSEDQGDLPRFTGGAVGYLAYEAMSRFESRVGRAKGQGLGAPDARFHIAETLVVFDHLERVMKVVSHVDVSDPTRIAEAYEEAVTRIDAVVELLNGPISMPDTKPAPADLDPVTDRFRLNTSPERYREIVERGKQYIHDGDIIQVVLSQRVDVPTPAHPFSLYRALRMINPSPYMFYLDFEDHQVVGASPELLVRLEDGIVTNHPIAGTRPRGENDEEDERLAQELLADEKERAEHIMLVDLGRNDVGRVSKPGKVRVPQLMEVEKFSHVMHIVSHVEGELRDDLTGLDALRACFPAGTVSGAPKIRAMEIIAELETDARGVYSGAVGYVDFSGGMDTAIALRTMVVHGGIASLQAGGGIVADSTPEGEYAESFHKMRALIRAIERAEDLERLEGAISDKGGIS